MDPMQHIFAQFASWYSKQQNGCDVALNILNLNLNDQIIFDIGITDHIFCNKDFFYQYRTYQKYQTCIGCQWYKSPNWLYRKL
jgi:hypothetical protein